MKNPTTWWFWYSFSIHLSLFLITHTYLLQHQWVSENPDEFEFKHGSSQRPCWECGLVRPFLRPQVPRSNLILLSSLHSTQVPIGHWNSQGLQNHIQLPCQQQVWTLTQFLPFFVKNHWCAWRANQWPLIGETLFSSVPPSNSLISFADPWRASLSRHGAL